MIQPTHAFFLPITKKTSSTLKNGDNQQNQHFPINMENATSKHAKRPNDQPSISITFRATQNDVTPTKISQYRHDALCEIIENNNAFQRAGKKNIIQSSTTASTLCHAKHGLVSAIIDAYNHHHNLVLRPDDVWQAILTQFSFYVNANAEALRDKFVNFKDKKSLTIQSGGSLFSVDFANMANIMVDEQIASNLKDADVTDWLLPKFTTTRPDDRVTASVTIMSTLQEYFIYSFDLKCGIPYVTLEGTPEDWRLLLAKIDRLPQYDNESKVMTIWHGKLSEVVKEFVKSVEGEPDIKFWDRVASHEGGGSGPSYLSGWVTVFASFNAKGQWQGGCQGGCRIDTKNLPVGAASVPVRVNDNGTEYDAVMVAGQMAYEAKGDNMDTVQPRNDWCFVI